MSRFGMAERARSIGRTRTVALVVAFVVGSVAVRMAVRRMGPTSCAEAWHETGERWNAAREAVVLAGDEPATAAEIGGTLLAISTLGPARSAREITMYAEDFLEIAYHGRSIEALSAVAEAQDATHDVFRVCR